MTKQLSNGFKRSVYWNSYQSNYSRKSHRKKKKIYELLSAPFQAIKRSFVVVYDAPDDNEAGIKNNTKYFLPKGITEKCSEFINDRNFYDQQNNDLIKQYDKVRKVST